MNRRGFFASLSGALASSAYDPERLLWRPGAKLISIPPASLARYNADLASHYYATEFQLYVNPVIIDHWIDWHDLDVDRRWRA